MPARQPDEPESSTYQRLLFDDYARRTDELDRDRKDKLDWFVGYVRENYRAELPEPGSSPAIADIGCSRGYLLEALQTVGYTSLVGVDVSPGDLDHARTHQPSATFVQEDGATFLTQHIGDFDVVIMRAIVEHVRKDEVIPLLTAARGAIKPGGVVIVDVPNMDWLFAGHERYMDFTHEIGFTRDSLAQVMRLMFESTAIREVDHLSTADRRSWRTRLGRAALNRLITWADPQGGANPIWARNIIAFGRG